MISPSNLPSQHSASTCRPTRPPRPRCRLRSALRLRPSAEAPHGRQTTALRRGFVPVGAIAVGEATPAPHGTRPVLAANQGHGMSFFFVYADRTLLAVLKVLCSIPRQFGYGGSDANLRTCIGGGLGASIQAGNAAEGITLGTPWVQRLVAVRGSASPRLRARRGARR